MIRSERARMGGDWAVCCLLLTRQIRDVVRWNFMFFMPINVAQRGIGRGTACDLLGYGARGSDGQVTYAFP